ncbi:hypothetical protein [Paenibacillus sp. MBLB4367]|uniref:hypothetical protein n=1 Tax=Paenibacillus sp. MBLB4367 TaxID=3384767 RepID=UPI0039081D9A
MNEDSVVQRNGLSNRHIGSEIADFGGVMMEPMPGQRGFADFEGVMMEPMPGQRGFADFEGVIPTLPARLCGIRLG